jgi:Tol biopolymer transport system component
MSGSRVIPATGIWVESDTGVHRLDTPSRACDPAWSPDGSALSFTTPDGLWILSDLESSQPRLLIEAPETSEGTEFDYVAFMRPVWSPNGARLGYIATNGGTTWVEVIEVLDGRLRYRSREETYAFSWGADSRSLGIGGNTILVP